MTRSISLRRKTTWNISYFSTGELTLAEHAASAGKRTRGGAEVRLLNIEADAGKDLGLFEDLHGAASPNAFANDLQHSARRYFGQPFRAFVEQLTLSREEVKRYILQVRRDFIEELVPNTAGGEIRRAAERFALTGAAGELATGWELTSWENGEALETARRCFREWMEKRGTKGSSDLEAAIRQVRLLLQSQGISRFPRIDRRGTSVVGDQVARDQAGFRHHNGDGHCEYWIFTEVFKSEFCKGYSVQAVAKELHNRGYLRRTETHLTIKERVPGAKDPIRVYCVSEKILEGDKC